MYFSERILDNAGVDYQSVMDVSFEEYMTYIYDKPNFELEVACVYLDRQHGLTDTKYPKMLLEI